MKGPITFLAAILAVAPALAHPGHSVEQEIAERSAYLKHAPRDLSHCAAKMQERGIAKRAIERRAATVKQLRDEVSLKKRALAKRQASGTASGVTPSGTGGMPSGTAGGAASKPSSDTLSDWGAQVANSSHLSNLTVTPGMAGVEDIIFSNASCILSPEGEIGPFYVQGELIRSNIVDDQEGVPIHIDGQFVDLNTCEPIPNLYWDLWNCNATGVYGGVIGNGNGNSNDTSNLNNTFLRGIQPTDSDGVAQFDSLFPGHYAGRATHIHVVTHIGSSRLSNGTLTGGNVTHIGQLFFDQDLITEINTNVYPYSDNSIAIVENADDRVFASETETHSDPVFDYVMLGDDVEDGLFMWISMGVDPTASYETSAAAIYGANGGVETK